MSARLSNKPMQTDDRYAIAADRHRRWPDRMRAAEKEPYLAAVDAALADRGFRRPRRSHEWSRRDGDDRVWCHLNFGRAQIGLSIGVEFLDVRDAWSDLPGGIFGVSEHPQDEWSSGDSPASLADYVSGVVASRVDMLRDRDVSIERLLSPDWRSWPTFCYSARIRLLPVLMVARGRQMEALELCRGIEGESLRRDQIRPSFTEFREAFEAKLAN